LPGMWQVAHTHQVDSHPHDDHVRDMTHTS
jgi:hypothetical protein